MEIFSVKTCGYINIFNLEELSAGFKSIKFIYQQKTLLFN